MFRWDRPKCPAKMIAIRPIRRQPCAPLSIPEKFSIAVCARYWSLALSFSPDFVDRAATKAGSANGWQDIEEPLPCVNQTKMESTSYTFMGLRWGFSLSAPTARLDPRGAGAASALIIRFRRIQKWHSRSAHRLMPLMLGRQCLNNSTCRVGGARGRRNDGSGEGPRSGTIIAFGRSGRWHAKDVRTHKTVLHQGCGDPSREADQLRDGSSRRPDRLLQPRSRFEHLSAQLQGDLDRRRAEATSSPVRSFTS